MAINAEAMSLWKLRGFGPRKERSGVALELSALGGRKNYLLGTREGLLVNILTTRCSSSSRTASTVLPLQQRLQKVSLKASSVNGSYVSLTDRKASRACRAKNSAEVDADDDHEDNNAYNANGFDRNGFDRNGRDSVRLDRMGVPGDAVFDSPIVESEYHSYIDPNTGEPSPTYGFRNSLPSEAFWGEDLSKIQNSSPSNAGADRLSKSSVGGDEAWASDTEAWAIDADGFDSDSETSVSKRRTRAGGRRNKTGNSTVEQEGYQREELSEVELANIAELEALRAKFRAEEETGEYKSIAQVIKESKEEEKTGNVDGGVSEDGKEEEEEEEEDVSLGTIYGDNGFGDRGYALVSSNKGGGDIDIGEPLTNDELWWNWQKPLPGKKPWSAWQKRAGDSDTVMAAAMAEAGQIKLFGEKPTIAEATLARARKRVFYNERMEAEEARKKEIGALAYYKEWVKAYPKDTSIEAVQEHFEETGEDEGIQLLDMFAYQTDREYRVMQGTDVRVRRDPLTMRMRPDQIKQVWGGDPVYPTINYEQDPEAIADYRNENMHEPIPDIVEMLRESGRLITQEEVKAMLKQEKIEDDELATFDGLAGAIDIGDEDEDELDGDEDEIDLEDPTDVPSVLANSTLLSKKSSPATQMTSGLDDVIGADDIDEVSDVDSMTDEDADEEKDASVILD